MGTICVPGLGWSFLFYFIIFGMEMGTAPKNVG